MIVAPEPGVGAIVPLTIPPTIDELVYTALRDAVVRDLAPGTPLKLRDLAARFSTSTMPIRAALAQLEAEGLVVQEARRGAHVAPLDFRDLEDIQLIRSGIERVAARSGLLEISDDGLRRVADAASRLSGLAAHGDQLESYLAVSRELHDLVYAAADHPRLLGSISQYRRAAERYLRQVLIAADRVPVDLALQQEFAEACAERDVERAERAIESLLAWTVVQFAEHFGETPSRVFAWAHRT